MLTFQFFCLELHIELQINTHLQICSAVQMQRAVGLVPKKVTMEVWRAVGADPRADSTGSSTFLQRSYYLHKAHYLRNNTG